MPNPTNQSSYEPVGSVVTAMQVPLQDAIQAQVSSNDTRTAAAPQPSATALPAPPAGKVAIPRANSTIIQGGRRRVSRACESCRMRKSKCSGQKPACRQCRELSIRCIYPSSARENNIRQQADLQKQLQACRSLLEEAKVFSPGRTAEKIEEFLQAPLTPRGTDSASSESPFRFNSTRDTPKDEPSALSSSVGSLKSLDQVEYDVNSTAEARSVGNIGKSSEITWMQRVEKEAAQGRKGPAGEFGFDTSSADISGTTLDEPHPYNLNYHLDDLEIGISEPGQVYTMPPQSLADTLLNTYLRVTHPCLLLISRTVFCTQYANFFDNFAIPNDKWLAILNMIFAIAASYAQKAGLEQHGEPQDHLLYFTRARLLSMDGEHLFSHPDLQQVQVEGLIALYLLSTDQIHRSWRISTLAIRSAVSLGINLKNSDQKVSSVSKETRNRLWWSLVIIENRLSIMTGRPSCLSVKMCSSPIPLPFGEDQLQTPTARMLLDDPRFRDMRLNNVMASSQLQPMSFARPTGNENIAESHEWLSSLPATAELSFIYACDLTILMQGMLEDLYMPNSVHHTRRQLQECIEKIKSRVDAWFTSIPNSLDFTLVKDNDEAQYEKTRLACQYYSTRIMLGRPCLCVPHKSRGSSDDEEKFAHDMAVTAVESACHMAELIPESLEDDEMFGISPWWCSLHYVMQTVTVLILELSFSCIHMVEQKNNILSLAKRCIYWLDQKSKHSLASQRAWEFCTKSLRRLAQPMGLKVDDLPSRSSRKMQGSNQNLSSVGQTQPEAWDYSSIPANNMQDMFQPHEQFDYMALTNPSADIGDYSAYVPSDSAVGCFVEPSWNEFENDNL
ncbi:transcriptional regulator family: Fungal Specific TF [Penicillium herquei]|nr:transcriptional regulator family: Fungal Specific TF [Penicillium herquei]